MEIMDINITEKAESKLVKILEESELNDASLRVIYSGAGWGGPKLGLALDEPSKKDLTLEKGKIKIVMDKYVEEVVGYNLPLKIDFIKTFSGEGFVVGNGSSCWF